MLPAGSVPALAVVVGVSAVFCLQSPVCLRGGWSARDGQPTASIPRATVYL